MIQAMGLTKIFGKKIAVNEIDLNVSKGEIYGFLGENGAGKTTTIRMLTGTLRPTKGEIKIGGIDLKKDEIAVKKIIGVVPDEPKLYDNLKGYEFLNFIMDIYGLDKNETSKTLDEICDAFNIDYLNSYCSEYSHGMKQKLALANVLMRKPQIIFLDEPTVGLDAKSAKILKVLLQKYSKNGVTIFLTTHILEIAEKMCSRIGIINEGNIIAEGTMDELREKSGMREEGLEDIFLKLTGTSEDNINDIIESL
jgi:ABC-2 type transport system ATP-binding protein